MKNKLFFILGFLLPLPAYFNDSIAEYIQDLGGGLWTLFYSLGFVLYPFYLAIFALPTFLIISLILVNLNESLVFSNIFFKLLYGFFVSSGIFVLFALIAISQFQFGF